MVQYKELTASLRELRSLGVPRSRTAAVERRLGEAYGEGFQALLAARRDPVLGARLAKTRFAPAMRRFDGAIATSPRARTGSPARRSSAPGSGWLGSLASAWRCCSSSAGGCTASSGAPPVAEQARAAQRRGEERLHALVRHSSDVVAVVDGTSQVRWLAESVRGALGYDPCRPRRWPLTDLVHTDDASMPPASWRRPPSARAAPAR
jgi:PAS domain-containing protein